MAAVKKKTIALGGKSDPQAYAEFLRGLLAGTILSNALTETTTPNGTQDVHVPQFDPNDGHPLPDVVVNVPRSKLVKLEYDDLS